MKKNSATLYPWQRLAFADAQPLESLTSRQRISIIKMLDPRLLEESIAARSVAARLVKEVEISIRRYRAFRQRHKEQILPTDQKASIKAAITMHKRLWRRLRTFDLETEKRLISSLGKELADSSSVLERFDLGEKRLIRLGTDLALLEKAFMMTLERTRPMPAGRNKNADVRTISEFLLETWEKHNQELISKDGKIRKRAFEFLKAVFVVADSNIKVDDVLKALSWAIKRRKRKEIDVEDCLAESEQEDAYIRERRRKKK